MDNTTKDIHKAAENYANGINQSDMKKAFSRVDFKAGANWMQETRLTQFEEMKKALEKIANAPYPYNDYERESWIETARTLSAASLASLSETNEKP